MTQVLLIPRLEHINQLVSAKQAS